MNPIIFSILCVSVAEALSKKALLFNLKTHTLDDVCREDGDKKCPPYLIACPASTPQEKQFNRDVSLTKRSVFSRLISAENESARNIVVDFCEKSFKPAMLYNSHTYEKQYKIGYELYFKNGEFPKEWSSRKQYYYNYKMVNTNKPKRRIKNQTIPNTTSELVIRYEDEADILYNFTDGSRTLGFYWINVLSIKCSKHNRYVVGKYWGDVKFENLKKKCRNYPLADQDLYSKENQKKCLKDIFIPSSLFEGNPDQSCGQPYGCLIRSQIMPLWYFSSSSAKLASCSHLNIIPVWESIANGNLRRVDLFIFTLEKKLQEVYVTFGVSGVLKTKTSADSNKTRKVYLSDAKRDRVVEIPKIIYRIVHFDADVGYVTCDTYEFYAAIIIHNDPTTIVQDADKVCNKNDALPGWDKIINDDPKTGLTYVCPVTRDLQNKLGFSLQYLYYSDRTPDLNLNAIRNGDSCIFSYDDETENINSSFEKLLKQYHTLSEL